MAKNNWNEKTKKEKSAFIIKVVFVVLALVFLIIGFFSEQLFGTGNILSQSVGDLLNFVDMFEEKLPTILKSITIIVLYTIISKLLRMLLAAIMSKVKKGNSVENLLDSIIKYLFAIIMIFLVLRAWGVDTTTLLASAGILGLVVGLGAQSLIEDIISGLFIIFEKTFQVDDIIVVDGFRGTVTEIGIRNTKIIDAGGDVKVISNSDIRTVINMTRDLSVAICDLSIEYGESIERVENVINAELPRIKERIPTITEGPFYKGVAALADSAVILKIIAKCKEEDKFQVVRDLNREFKIIFDKNNINIPFPQIVLNQPITFDSITNKEREKANKFVDEQKELSKHIDDNDLSK